jgi:hypothetical protein
MNAKKWWSGLNIRKCHCFAFNTVQANCSCGCFNCGDREQKLEGIRFCPGRLHICKQREAAEDILNMLKEDGYDAEITEPDQIAKPHVGPVTLSISE